MKKAFELIKERLGEAKKTDVCSEISCCDCSSRYECKNCDEKQQYLTADKCIEIVSEVEAEYNKRFEPTIDCIEYGIYGFNLYLKEQYRKGYEDAKAEYGNGWIPVEKALPKERDWYLAMFKEPDTGFMGLPFIADYLMGVHTNYTTEDGWIIANCTDTEEASAEYYKKLVCVAWMPLPSPYTPTTD